MGVCCGPRILPAHIHLPEEGGRPQPSPETAEDDALARLRRAVAWAWDRHEGRGRLELHDLLERELLAFALARLNQTQAADRIGMARGAVNQRAQKYGLKRRPSRRSRRERAALAGRTAGGPRRPAPPGLPAAVSFFRF